MFLLIYCSFLQFSFYFVFLYNHLNQTSALFYAIYKFITGIANSISSLIMVISTKFLISFL